MSLFDRAVAPQATRAEITLSVAAAALGAALSGVSAWYADLPVLAVVVIVAVALDVYGGVVVNATQSNRRWFHRPGRGRRFQLCYVAAHVHPFVLAWAVPGFSWPAAVLIYGSIVAASWVITAVPGTLRRPTGFALTALCISAVAGVTTIPRAVAWFAPILMIQLLLAHLATNPTPESQEER